MYKIMIVDDEEGALEYVRQLIDAIDFKVQIVGQAHNGEEGLQVFQKTRPDIVLTDVVMPGMTGLEMVDRMIQTGADCFYIILTAYHDFNYANQAIDLEVKSYILKHELDEEILRKTLENIKQHLHRRMISAMRKKWDDYQAALERGFAALPDFLNADVPQSDAVLFQVEMMEKGQAPKEESLQAALAEESEKEKRHFDVLYYGEGRMTVALYLPPLSKGKSFRHRFILQQCSRLKNLAGNPMAVGISLPFSCWDGLKDAANQASEALSRRFFLKNETAFFYGEQGGADEHTAEREDLLSELETKIRQKESDFALSLKALLKLHCQSCSKALYQQDLDRILLMTGTYLHGNVILLSRAVADCPSIDEVFSVLQDLIAALMPQSSPKLKQILRYIQTHYNQQITLEELSDTFFISKIYICQLFKRELDSSFKSYLNQIRMEKADELLASGNYKVYEVAEMVGYQSSTYFSNAYKKYKRYAPKAAR